MKNQFIIAILLLAATASARWDTILWDSSRESRPNGEGDLLTVDVSATNRSKVRNPEYNARMSGVETPALYDRANGAAIPWLGSITSSVANIEGSTQKKTIFRSVLGTNKFQIVRSALRQEIDSATTNGATIGQIRGALFASLKLNRLEHAWMQKELERIKLSMSEDENED